ncbi:MAG: glycosyltransferase 87 family protein [Labilithrix sp.]
MSEDEDKPSGGDAPDEAAASDEPTADAKAGADAPTSVPEKRGWSAWMTPESRSRRIIIGLGIYVACCVVFAIMAGDRMLVHTPYNHFALQADAWLHGRHDLGGSPPSYAGMNDFALFRDKWFISFPPFPAMLMVPFVWLSGSPENFRDGQLVVWFAGIGPAVLFLVFEKLRRTGRSVRSEIDNIRLALLFAFGTVYFFSAVQGTVWFAGHVVGVGLLSLFVLFALDAERPALAGLMLGFMFLTRVTTLLTGVFFALELARIAYGKTLPGEGPLADRIEEVVKGLDRAKFTRIAVRFALPVLACFAFAAWLNHSRFGNPAPWAFGHEYLQVGWKTRIDRWGLFSFHFLPRNLSVVLGSLPWKPSPNDAKVPFEIFGQKLQVSHWMISGHGLALWWTTPLYLWLVRPKQKDFLWGAAWIAALGPLAMNLLYQNSGWFQFGYRFSNDYSVFLFVLLAISTPKLSRWFWAAAAWAIAWNAFGAASFERPKYDAFYSHEAATPTRKYGNSTQDLVYPPD